MGCVRRSLGQLLPAGCHCRPTAASLAPALGNPPLALPCPPQGGVKSFLSCLREHAELVRSAEDPRCWLLADADADPLQRSLWQVPAWLAVIGRWSVGAGSCVSCEHASLSVALSVSTTALLPAAR